MANIPPEDQQRTIAERSGRKELEDEEWCLIPQDWWKTFCTYCGLNPRNATELVERTDGPKPGIIDYTNVLKDDNADYLFKDEIKEGITENADFAWVHSEVYEYFKLWGYTDQTDDELRNGVRRKVITRGNSREKQIEMKPYSVRYTVVRQDKMSKPVSVRVSAKNNLYALLKKVYKMDRNEKGETKEKEEKEEKEEKSGEEVPGRIWYLEEGWKLLVNDDMKIQMEKLWHGLTKRKEDKWLTILLEFKNGEKFSPKWREYLGVGSLVDVEDPKGNWYESVVLLVDKETERIKVRYSGWSSKWDEYISIHSKRLETQGTRTTGPYDPNARQNVEEYDTPLIGAPRSRFFQRQNSIGAPPVCGAVGLRNLGNTCFMNSTLQCLSNTPGLTPYFKDDKYKAEINLSNPLGWKGKVANSYANLIKEMWGSKYKTVAPVKFKEAIGEVQPRFSGFQQHDSSELLQFLLDGLHEDLNRVIEKPYTQAVDGNGRSDHEVAKEAWDRHLLRNKSIIVDLCQGQLKSKVVCPDCDNASTTFDPFMFVSVPIPERRSNVKLDDCFAEFNKEEILSENDAWYCRSCKKHQQASKKFDIWTLPDTLIIHLKRFHFDQMSRSKVETEVDFPTHGLDMRRYVANQKIPQEDCLYDLFAVSNHFGNLGGGHYTAYAQNITDNKWYHLNDETVQPLRHVNDAKTSSAYVLFYQRSKKRLKHVKSKIASTSTATVMTTATTDEQR